jgi:hypothetical protein
MALIIGSRYDLCSCRTYEFLRRRHPDVYFLEEADLFTKIGVSWSPTDSGNAGFLRIGNHKAPFHSIGGVLARLGGSVTEPDLRQEDRLYATVEKNAAVVGWLNHLPCRVVNRPVPTRIFQPVFASEEAILKIRRSGLKILATYLSSSLDAALAFFERCERRALLGAPSGIPPAVPAIGQAGIARIKAASARHPISLQRLPEGEWVRVFVVGDQAFAAAVRSENDGGESGGTIESAAISDAVASRCRRLARDMELEFAQIDLLKAEGADYCIGIGAFPLIEPCEEALQTAIVEALGELLHRDAAEGLS